MYILIGILIIFLLYVYFTKKKNEKNIKDKEQSRCDLYDEKENIKIIHVTDTHYFSSKLTDYKEAFDLYINSDDGKIIRYSEQIMDTFISEMAEMKPDLIIISGDLTYNGEKLSHEDFSKKLYKLKDNNIPLIVLPGNHDIENKNTKAFFEDKEEDVDNVDITYFKKIYKDFGYGDSSKIVSRDKKSMSYVYRLNSKISILALETSLGKNNQYITNSTYKWIEKELKRAKANNNIVISVTHQNILAHNKMFISGYKIENSSRLIELYSQYGVKVNLSGHMHIQHISEYKDVYDIALSSLAIYPNQFAEINIDKRLRFNYVTKKINVPYWVELYGKPDKNLINFPAYSKDFFINTSKMHTDRVLKNLKIEEDKKHKMVNFLVETNLGYFSGTMDEYPGLSIKSDSYKLWQEYCQKTYLSSYLDSVYVEGKKNHNSLEVNL